MIGIYLDASKKIGLGHLQRCIKLKNVFPKNKVIFFTRSKSLQRIFRNEKTFYYLIKSKKEFVNFILNKKIKIFIFDVRKIDNYLNNIFFKNTKTKYIYTVLIANTLKKVTKPNLTIFPVSVFKKPKSKNIYAGEKYAILSKTKPKKKIKNLKNIMISMGGSDPNNITTKVIRILNKLDFRVKLNIVIGKLSKIKNIHIKKILTNKMINYKVYKKQKNLNKVMMLSDILITNSGITKFEATLMKLPSIIISNDKETINNQIAFAKKKTSIYLGYYKSNKILHLVKLISELRNNIKYLVEMQNRSKKFLDHRGAARIKSIIYKNYNSE